MDELDAAQVRAQHMRERLLSLGAEELVDMLLLQKETLLRPVEGWYLFGTHVDRNVALEFWGIDIDGMPVWERQNGWRDTFDA